MHSMTRITITRNILFLVLYFYELQPLYYRRVIDISAYIRGWQRISVLNIFLNQCNKEAAVRRCIKGVAKQLVS